MLRTTSGLLRKAPRVAPVLARTSASKPAEQLLYQNVIECEPIYAFQLSNVDRDELQYMRWLNKSRNSPEHAKKVRQNPSDVMLSSLTVTATGTLLICSYLSSTIGNTAFSLDYTVSGQTYYAVSASSGMLAGLFGNMALDNIRDMFKHSITPDAAHQYFEITENLFQEHERMLNGKEARA